MAALTRKPKPKPKTTKKTYEWFNVFTPCNACHGTGVSEGSWGQRSVCVWCEGRRGTNRREKKLVRVEEVY